METKQIPMSDLRVAKGISQKKFAQEINVSPGLIGMYETGKRKPSLKKALMIAKYFDVPVESILFGKYDFEKRINPNQIVIEPCQQISIFDLAEEIK